MVLLILCLQVSLISSASFCFPTCVVCGGSAYYNCQGSSCNSGFYKPSYAGGTFTCIKSPYTYYYGCQRRTKRSRLLTLEFFRRGGGLRSDCVIHIALYAQVTVISMHVQLVTMSVNRPNLAAPPAAWLA